MRASGAAGNPHASVSRVPYTLDDAVKGSTKAARAVVDDTVVLLASHGPLRFGQGVIATIIALTLGVLCLLAV
ncbi:MAG TPA: hypothetical protein VKB52_13810, partial [Rhodanobacteraceae bacterium]|nr:hypothetical protein [Rhodanobacteraceae bacterium]